MGLPLAASDERNRFGIQLYHRTATQADLSGKQVLEVSWRPRRRSMLLLCAHIAPGVLHGAGLQRRRRSSRRRRALVLSRRQASSDADSASLADSALLANHLRHRPGESLSPAVTPLIREPWATIPVGSDHKERHRMTR
jgi:hypothetical protein